MPPPAIQAGRILALRLYDIAYGADLRHAERLWAAQATQAGARRRLASTPEKSMAFGDAPLAVALGPVSLDLGDATVIAHAEARLYDFGVVAIALNLPVADLSWEGFVDRVDAVDAAVGPHAASPWQDLLAELRGIVGPALDRPNARVIEEDYLMAVVRAFDAPVTAEELLERADLAPLLAGRTPHPLSPGARAELLRLRFSWHADDLVVLGWDRAFILEPRGETDVLDVLEVANAQLLEMRFYDELLDAELPRMYELVAAARRGARLVSARRYARLARQLNTLVGEVTEQTERVDNALQVTEDVHLARVYAAAMALFRVPAVSAAVDRKLAVIRGTYDGLYAEASGARGELLEATIVGLIVLEIVLSLAR